MATSGAERSLVGRCDAKPTSEMSPVSQSSARLAPSQLARVHPFASPVSGARRCFAAKHWTKVQQMAGFVSTTLRAEVTA